MATSEERFQKLNSVLGWGNLNAYIIYIGIEEAGDWSLRKIISSLVKQQILKSKEIRNISLRLDKKNIPPENLYTIVDLILRDEIGRGLLDCFDEYMDYYITHLESGIRTIDDNESQGLRQLERFQQYISMRLIEIDPIYDVGDLINQKMQFGTTTGNEVCMNYYPVGRSRMTMNYPEYVPLFGLHGQDRFYNANPQTDYEEIRKELLYSFLIQQSRIKERLVVFTLGKIETFNTFFLEKFPDLQPIKPTNFKKEGRGHYYYHFGINNIAVFNIYHPCNGWISYNQINELIERHF